MANRNHLTILPVLALLAACSSQQTTHTGFLDAGGAKPGLSIDGENPDSLSFTAPPERLTGYRQVVVDEVAYRPGPNVPARPDPAVVDDLRRAYRAALMEAFITRGYSAARPIPAPTAGSVLRVRAAVTGFERANVPLNVLTTLVIAPVTAGGAASEAEVLDAATGERLVGLAMHSNASPLLGGPQNYYLQHGHARAALARQARNLAARVPEVAGPTMGREAP